MITTLAEPLTAEETSTASHAVSLLLEPFLVVATGLFWAIVLPIAGVFCAGVALYDRFARHLTRPARSNPLVLRRTPEVSPGASEPSRAHQAARV